MTFAAFVAELIIAEKYRQRPGQLAYNMLRKVRPDLADQVRGQQGIDPFHRDDNLPAFFQFVEDNWT